MSTRVLRSLRAVLAADVVGYSRLMGEDEDATLDALGAFRGDHLSPAIARHDGALIKAMGDGWLVEFGAASDAFDCALALQRSAVDPIRLRIGIHVGDIVHHGEDIFGDGVNIAARLEQIAAPGGIAVSETARRSMNGRLAGELADLGTATLKNIAEPLRVFGWGMATLPRSDAPLPPTDRPSIAVLPFRNLSGDADQDLFADGMTEDLITDLSKVSGLFVVARNSSFALKGQQLQIGEAARRLGVRNVVEGSIRRSGTRVRINVQLVDALSGGQVWADRFDGTTDDVFELQDAVGAQVVSALSIRLSANENQRLRAVHTRNVEAYELFVRAKALPYPPVPARIDQALALFETVIGMAPEFAGGHAGLSWMLGFKAMWSHGDNTGFVRRAADAARKAVEADSSFGWSYAALGVSRMLQGDYNGSIDAARHAAELQPNDPDAHVFLGLLKALAGEAGRGIADVEEAIRLSPEFHLGPNFNILGFARLLAGDPAGTREAFRINAERNGPVGPPVLAWMAAACHELGDTEGAAAMSARLRRDFPAFRLEGWNFLTLPRSGEDRAFLLRAMLAGGVPG